MMHCLSSHQLILAWSHTTRTFWEMDQTTLAVRLTVIFHLLPMQALSPPNEWVGAWDSLDYYDKIFFPYCMGFKTQRQAFPPSGPQCITSLLW